MWRVGLGLSRPRATVCMPKAKYEFRRSNPSELKLFEAQDQCDIRAHTKFQLPKCRWSLMTMGQSRIILCGEKFFVHLKLKLKVKINAHGKKKSEPNQDGASDHFLSAKCLHTRPTFGRNNRFLLSKPSHPSHGQTRSTHFGTNIL